MTDEYRHSYLLGQCQELGSQIVCELMRAITIGKDSAYFAGRIEVAVALARRIRDIHEEEGSNPINSERRNDD